MGGSVDFSKISSDCCSRGLNYFCCISIFCAKKGSQEKLSIFNNKQARQFSMMSQKDNILRKAILFLLTLGCLEETLDIASIDFFKRYC